MSKPDRSTQLLLQCGAMFFGFLLLVLASAQDTRGGTSLTNKFNQQAQLPLTYSPPPPRTAPLWTATRSADAQQNAERHFKDHGVDFGA